MTPKYLENLAIIYTQPLWYTVAWGILGVMCLYAAYLPFRYMFKHDDHAPVTGAMACVVSASFGMFAVAPLLMVGFKIHAYLVFG